MKKQISIILAICIIFSCVSLCGCSFQGIIDQFTPTTKPSETMQPTEEPTQPSEQPTQPTEPTSSSSNTVDPEPEELVFEHGDNFTEEDIEFVKSLHGYQLMLYDPIIHTFSSMVTNVNSGRGYLYYANVDIDNPYYICAYFDWSVESTLREWGAGYIYVNHYVWYKFDSKETVPKKIDNLTLGLVLLVYDSTIIKDVGNDKDCEHNFRFYTLGYGEIKEFRAIYENMLIHHYEPIDENTIGIEEMPKSGRYYEVGKVADKQLYLKLYENALYEDGTISEGDNRKILGDYYDILSPYIQRVEELDYDFINIEGETLRILYLGINLDVLSEVLFMK